MWQHGISAELARDTRSPEDLLAQYRDDDAYSWIVIIKQDSVLKIKTLTSPGSRSSRVDDIDVATAKELLSWLKSEMRERDARSVTKYRAAAAATTSSDAPESSGTASHHHGHHHHDSSQEQDVHVLVAQTKSKKFNRRAVVEQAQTSAAQLVRGFLEGPIAAIETSDAVVDLVRATSLSDPESWRRVEHTVGTAEKKYVKEIHDMLKGWRWEWETKRGPGHAFVYNFRTGKCVYYDLGA